MPILFQHRIYRTDVKANPDVLYVFGDNDHREGLGGQAKEMRGEPNSVGVRTKRSPSNSPGSFYSDTSFLTNRLKMESDFERVLTHLESGGIVVFPSDGLGTGLSRLPEVAPITAKWLDGYIKKIVETYNK